MALLTMFTRGKDSSATSSKRKARVRIFGNGVMHVNARDIIESEEGREQIDALKKLQSNNQLIANNPR